jgi:3'-phosphoadenosine 5'-phosphosulfate sulfotransferase (PAPS reductase)/FAD synthetase
MDSFEKYQLEALTEADRQCDFCWNEIDKYERIVVAFSGGKDSLACLLLLLEQGVSPRCIELWHHCVDGFGSANALMDWPVTEDYCRQVANAFGIPIYYSWKEGGFETEMLRSDALTMPVWFESPDGVVRIAGTGGSRSTRLRFPQVSASLSTRWCSAYLKIDVASKALNHQSRFNQSRTLFITGERAQESASRARYAVFEPHRNDRRSGKLKRHVDHFRPVHAWSEHEVWDIIGRHKVNPHPAYRLGFGRLSCMTCIFGSANQWASVQKIAPDRFSRIAKYEEQFGYTINRKHSVHGMADRGVPYDAIPQELVASAMSASFGEPVIVSDWKLPAGAFGEASGPA